MPTDNAIGKGGTIVKMSEKWMTQYLYSHKPKPIADLQSPRPREAKKSLSVIFHCDIYISSQIHLQNICWNACNLAQITFSVPSSQSGDPLCIPDCVRPALATANNPPGGLGALWLVQPRPSINVACGYLALPCLAAASLRSTAQYISLHPLLIIARHGGVSFLYV